MRFINLVSLSLPCWLVVGASMELRTKRSELRLGELPDMASFYAFIGRNSSGWQEITSDSMDISSDTPKKVDGVTRKLSITRLNSSQLTSGNICHERNEWDGLICEDMGNHKWQYGFGDPLLIEYRADKLNTWLMSLANSIKRGRDIRDAQMDGGSLASRSLNEHKTIHFSVPWTDSRSENISKRSLRGQLWSDISQHFVFESESRTIKYQGSTASISGPSLLPAPEHLDNSTLVGLGNTTDKYTILIQAWRKKTVTLPKTSLECMAHAMKWHIDQSAKNHREICTQLSDTKAWWIWFKVNINRGNKNLVQTGACCEN